MSSLFVIMYRNKKTKLQERVEIFGKINCLEYIKKKRLEGYMSDNIIVQEFLEVNYFNINLKEMRPWDETTFPIKR